MAVLHVVRVFVGPGGTGGNPLGVFLDGHEIPRSRRQAIATDLGFSETVFVDDAASGSIQMFTPAAEIAFAGHPLVGTAWLLARERDPVASLTLSVGVVRVEYEGEVPWVEGDPKWKPQREFRQFATPEEVEALRPDDCRGFDLYAWAWLDEPGGVVRARYFAPGWGIAEDEATGSAAIFLGGLLQRPLLIRQGVGSEIRARPAPGGMVAVGGRVEPLEVRQLAA